MSDTSIAVRYKIQHTLSEIHNRILDIVILTKKNEKELTPNNVSNQDMCFTIHTRFKKLENVILNY